MNSSLSLQNLGRWKVNLSAKDPIPEAASDTETVVVVGKVMLKVVLLELLVV
jgi:ribosomal protein L18E